jgi:hypothetical protein
VHPREQLQKEVVPVAPDALTRFGQPVAERGAARRGDPVHEPVRLDWLRLPLRLDQRVAAEPFQDLVQVTDVQPAPLIADGLLEAVLELVSVGWACQLIARARRGAGASVSPASVDRP